MTPPTPPNNHPPVPTSLAFIHRHTQRRAIHAETECDRFCAMLLSVLIEIYCKQNNYQLGGKTDAN